MRKKRVYLDYAAATPLDRRVAKSMRPFESEKFANPASVHNEGIVARRVVAQARTEVARLLNVRSEEIIFTGGGTEADNLAITGIVEKAREKGIAAPHIITTNIEHPAILETCRRVTKWGGSVTFVPVQASGLVDPKHIAAALKPETVLVSVQLVNSEIGIIQPLRAIATVIAEYKATHGDTLSAFSELGYPYFHTDASQAPNYLDISFQKYGVDLMTLDGVKIYGPKGIGVLAIKRQVAIAPIIVGGGQERGMRAGTENVPAIVGFAAALTRTVQLREKETERLRGLQKYFIQNLKENFPRNVSIINDDCQKSVPNNVTICVRNGQEAELLVVRLDALGIACSAGSACTNLSTATYSYVIEALETASLSVLNDCKSSSIRFSFGRGTTRRDLDLTLIALRSIIK